MYKVLTVYLYNSRDLGSVKLGPATNYQTTPAAHRPYAFYVESLTKKKYISLWYPGDLFQVGIVSQINGLPVSVSYVEYN